MGTAITSAILDSKIEHYPAKVFTCNHSEAAAKATSETFADRDLVESFWRPQDIEEAIRKANVVILGCKPYMFEGIAQQYKDVFSDDTLVLSLLAGTTISELQKLTPKIARIMTNTPARFGCGTAAVAMSREAEEADCEFVMELANTVGLAMQISEKNMDAATALVGSGPAFCLLMMESLMDGAVRMGMPYDVAQLAAAKVMEGTAKMVLSTGEHPAALKSKVCTPGGTTIGGLLKMEDAGVRAGIARGVEEAAVIAASFAKK